MFHTNRQKVAPIFLYFAILVVASLFPLAARAAGKGNQQVEELQRSEKVDIESTFDQDVKDKRWSYEEMKKRRNRRRNNFFYAGFGFSVSGMAFEVKSNTNGATAVLSNGFLSANPLLGDMVRLGHEYSGNWFYFATELFGMSLFSVNTHGTIGELATGEAVSLTSFGRGTIMAGINLKPGFAFNNNKGAIYVIVGAAYQWVQGNYLQPSSAQPNHFDMSGFALNYGIGLKYTIYSFLMLFFDFTAIAPIRGNGALGLDRTAFDTSTHAVIQSINSSENYTINVGLDFRV